MSRNLEIRVSSKNTNGTEIWEGVVSIPGTRPTKLVKRTSGESTFNSRSSLFSSARSLAKSIGFDGVEETTSRKPAKKSSNQKTLVTN